MIHRESKRSEAIEEPDAAAAAGGAGFQLNLPNGVRIESGWDFPEQAMARLLRLAAER